MSDFIKHLRKLVAFSFPLSASSVLNMLPGFVAMLFIARIGAQELAAAALAVSTFTMASIIVTVFYAVGILISHARGLEKPASEIGELIKNAFWVALVFMIPASVILWNGPALLLFFHQKPELVSLTQGYFHYAAWVIPPLLFNTVLAQFYVGTARPRFSFIISIITLPLTIILAYGFILGKFHLPKMNLAGAAIAMLITQIIVSVAVVIYMHVRHEFKRYAFFQGSYWPNFSIIKKIIGLGFPIGSQFMAELLAMIASTYLMGLFGVNALAAAQIVSQFYILVLMIILGLSQATSVLVSESLATKDFPEIRAFLFSGLICFGVIIFITAVFYVVFPNWLIHFFIKENRGNEQIIYYAHLFLLINLIILFADSCRHIFSSVLRGLHDSMTPMLINIASLWLLSLPFAYLLGFLAGQGPIGLRCGMAMGFIFAAIYLSLRINKKIISVSGEKNHAVL